jgi:hypothetical protein
MNEIKSTVKTSNCKTERYELKMEKGANMKDCV